MGDKIKLKNNILILYLIDKMDLPLPMSQIEIVALEYMNYFALNESIHDLIEIKYIESSKVSNDDTRYSITDEGLQALDYFDRLLEQDVRNKINQYVLENHKSIKRDYQTTANYFQPLGSDEFTVKCALYEDDIMLLEVNLSVVSLQQARLICENWKNNITKLYGSILENLIDTNAKSINNSK